MAWLATQFTATMRIVSLSLLALVSLLGVSCTSFESAWDESVKSYHIGTVKAPAGPWIGNWTTVTNGHTGKLRAIVTPVAGSPDEYSFRYKATWAKVFTGGYTVTFPVTRQGGTYLVDGEQKLALFGSFGHKARITSRSFEASYSNDAGDLGAFSMRRPQE